MCCRMNRYLFYSLSCLSILLAAMLLTGCVTPIPLAQEAPDLSYKAKSSMVVAAIDERHILAQGKPPTYIGRAHGLFGIPSDMQAYPWFVSDKNKKEQTLAQALEERIVVGLNNEWWQLVAAGYTTRPTKEETLTLLADHNAKRLLVLSITQWVISINLNWVNAFNFDWGYRFDVLDEQGVVVTTISDLGRDVVDEEAKQSYQNLVKLAFRERLIKIFERPEVKAALTNTTIPKDMYMQPSSPTVQPSSPIVQPSSPIVRSSSQTVRGNQAEGMLHYIIAPRPSWLREVDARDNDDCESIMSITKNVGGTGDVSKLVKSAKNSAMTEAINNGADSYFIVNTESKAFGASVTLEALKCN